ncbi:hypothetical protein HRR83_001817 [Exophiala dermatitidis]|uniref:Uncharacterized protein n=1 Tax=Exophiala dermatitidis TaxID=5970 RepID=A0AAN6J240_EXODE|nr:hypothetical protein HRR73_004948 [Exophiala dermatitidis]KAJ4523275.1 hypothetical protein HRR75_001676 [Exophiala dermatitidis]KAJ4526620.1 hypothetical protein HRR74_001820 [Exophiala dermatitidis]KAJ4532132.1 hypothetical protein HRR76_007131 [Exophiala dermatitidis]KAJ4546167.1 hypothetical protein HRR77_004704 [Exophiala dermatitidis]
MASSHRVSRSLCDNLSKTTTPRYICRTCRSQGITPNAQQTRRISSDSISRQQSASATRKAWLTKNRLQPGSTASFSTRAASLAESRTTDEDPEYKEAYTWDGLEHIGHQGHWRDLPPRPEDEFEPWLVPSATPTLDRNEFLGYLYVALIEKLPYQGQNPALQQTATERTLDEGSAIDVSSLQIKLSPLGTFSHLEDKAEKGPEETSTFEATQGESKAFEISVAAMEEQLAGAKFDFSSPLTFEILKRFSQLSGFRVPDPTLNAVLRGNKTALDFVELLTQTSKPKPKTVSEALIAKQRQALLGLDGQASTPTAIDAAKEASAARKNNKNSKSQVSQPLGPNVMVLSRRETPVDKEKELGRWKVIERELRARGLPVLGHKVLAPQGEEWNQAAAKQTTA